MVSSSATTESQETKRGLPRIYIDVNGSSGVQKWARYEYGCDRCDWWGFQSSLLKILWRVVRHLRDHRVTK